MTAEQNAANLKSARNVVAYQLGYDDPENLTYEQRIVFNKALAEYIVAHPGSFSSGSVDSAKLIAAQTYDPLSDPSFDWDQFASEAVTNAAGVGDALADVGKGATAALSSLKWALPVALLVAIGIGLWGFKKRVAP
jgi:hypothetical protein